MYQPKMFILSHSRSPGRYGHIQPHARTHPTRLKTITYSPMTLYQTSKLPRNPTGAGLNRGTVIGTCCLGTRAINFLSSYRKCARFSKSLLLGLTLSYSSVVIRSFLDARSRGLLFLELQRRRHFYVAHLVLTSDFWLVIHGSCFSHGFTFWSHLDIKTFLRLCFYFPKVGSQFIVLRNDCEDERGFNEHKKLMFSYASLVAFFCSTATFTSSPFTSYLSYPCS